MSGFFVEHIIKQGEWSLKQPAIDDTASGSN